MDSTRQKRTVMSIFFILALAVAIALSGCIFRTTPPGGPPAEGDVSEGQPGSTAGDSTPKPGDTPTHTPTATLPVVAIVVSRLNIIEVHSGPGEEYPIIAEITFGQVVRVLGTNKDQTWLYILMPDNRKGWTEIGKFEEIKPEELPIFLPTPTPTPGKRPRPTEDGPPYGGGILAPPELVGMTPATTRVPIRKALSLATVAVICF